MVNQSEVDKLAKQLKISKEEALDIWLTDRGLSVNEEQEILDKKAKNAGMRAQSGTKTSKKMHEVKVSAEKRELFDQIYDYLCDFYCGNLTVLKENKLISLKIGEKTFKIDIIEQRPSKN